MQPCQAVLNGEHIALRVKSRSSVFDLNEFTSELEVLLPYWVAPDSE
jgi:hypothetical protein